MNSSTIRNRPRVLFCVVSIASFTQRDIVAVSSKYPVVTVQCDSLRSTMKAIARIPRADCLLCWFGSLRFLPVVFLGRVLGKKVLIVSGGYDVANVPELRYGEMYGIVRRYLGRILFKMAHAVACVSQSNAEETIRHAKVSPGKIRMIYHGFYSDLLTEQVSNKKKKKFVLTVGRIDMCTIHRKGLLNFVKVSRLLPDIPFIVVGPFDDEAIQVLRDVAGDNVTFTGYISKEDLGDLYAQAKVYLQPSIHEAFGCSVAEAMLYNCVPVVSNRYALPEVVGSAGICVDPLDIEGLASAVKKALDEDIQLPENPRQRILSKFPMSKRKAQLLEIIDDLIPY